jgi:MFS family permease
VYSAVGPRVPRRGTFVLGLVAAAGVGVTFALWPPYWVQLTLMALTGALTGPVSPINNVVIQERAPEQMRGRVLSSVFTLDYALFPVGYAAAGFLVRGSGIATTLWAMSAATAAVALWAAFTPALRDIETPQADPAG